MIDKKVSIVLPVYNGADYIADSINSIINQTYQNWELIVVNDCSTDNTLEICSKLSEKDSRIRVISNEKNLKLPNTLNAGFDVATGDYYTWTSDDNIYKPNAIETLVSTLNQNKDAVMVYADYTSIDADGNVLHEEKLQDPQFIVTGNGCGACFLYTAEVAKKVGRYDANLFLAEDYDYWIRIYRCGRMIHITDNLYLYRLHSGSLTETKKESVQEQTYKVIEKNFLPLYADAKRNHLGYEFFDQMLSCRQDCMEETKELLLSVDKGYRRFLYRRAFKESLIRVLRNTLIYRILKGKKGTIC